MFSAQWVVSQHWLTPSLLWPDSLSSSGLIFFGHFTLFCLFNPHISVHLSGGNFLLRYILPSSTKHVWTGCLELLPVMQVILRSTGYVQATGLEIVPRKICLKITKKSHVGLIQPFWMNWVADFACLSVITTASLERNFKFTTIHIKKANMLLTNVFNILYKEI